MLRRAPLSLAAALVVFTGLGLASPASATPLGVVLETEPDILSNFLSVGYNATSDALSASGFASTLFSGGGSDAIAGGSFSLSATIDSAGTLAGGGTISITGTIAGLGFNSGTLLTGNLTAVGFPDGSAGVLEFLFDVTGGDAAALYTPTGFTGATIIGAPNGFPGNWNSDFGVSFATVSDTGITVPEPSLALLLAPGLLALGRARRRRA